MFLPARRLWAVTLLLGLLFDVFFWQRNLGLNFALFTAACLAGGVWVLRKAGLRPAPVFFFLLGPIAGLALVTFARREPLPVLLAFVGTLFLLALVAISFRGAPFWRWGFWEYVQSFLCLLETVVMHPVIFRDQGVEPLPERRTSGRWRALAKGIILAAPLVLVFAALFVAADPMYATYLQGLGAFLGPERFGELALRAFLILLAAYALAGAYRHAAYRSGPDSLPETGQPLTLTRLSATEAAVVLAGVTLVILSFVAVQLRVLFGGESFLLQAGLTYAEYARRGFGELLVVTVLAALLLVVLQALTKTESEGQRRWLARLRLGLLLSLAPILVSSWLRLSLYEQAYGFTRSRLYAHVFVLWVALFLALMAVLERRMGQGIASAALLCALGFVLSLGALGVDGALTRRNLARAAAGAPFDVAYHASLSADVLPVLTQALQDTSLPEALREPVAASAACLAFRLGDQLGDQPVPSWSWSLWRARRSWQQLAPLLATYQREGEGRRLAVLSPTGQRYPCRSESSR